MKLSERLFVEQAGRCHYCKRMCQPSNGKILTEKEQPWDLWTLDEIEPRVHGGKRCYANVVGACRSCNLHKGAKDARKFTRREAYKMQAVGAENDKLFLYLGAWWPRTLYKLRRDLGLI